MFFAFCVSEPRLRYIGVRSGIADADISDESGEIVLHTQDASVVDENVSPLTSTAADSGSNFDAIMKVLQSIQKQNQEIENRLEQQGLKTELQVEDLSQRFKELGTRVNNQATQLETELKLHGDKLTVKINALEEDFVNKVEFLDSKQRSFEEDVKEWLKGRQEKFDSQLKTFSDKLSKTLDTAEQQMHVKVENVTPLKASLSPEVSKFSTPLSASSGDPEQKRPVQKPPSFDGKSQWEPYIAQFEIVAGMNQWNDEQKGNYLATSLKGSALSLLGNLPSDTSQDYKALVTALESRFGSAHQQELHRSKFKSRLRRRDESLQELAENLERLAMLAYPSAPEEMKDLLAKEQLIDAILDGDTRLRLKQSRPHSLRAALTLAMELESYRLASRQRDFQVRGVNCDTAEGTSTEKPGHGECGQDDLLAQVKGLLAEVVSQGRGHPYQGDPDTRPQCWGCGKRGHIKRNCWNLGGNWSRDVQTQGNSKSPLN